MTTAADQLIQDARAGDPSALGQLLELYRDYLRVLARAEIGRRLQGKVDGSDLVQETFLEAHRHFDQFRGVAEPQFVAWLRSILAANLANLVRRYLGTRGRDVRLERELSGSLNESALAMERGLVDQQSSPSQRACHSEQVFKLSEALAKLPDDYREVLIFRHLSGLTFPEVAERMGKTVDSVEKLWLRGLARLRQLVGAA